MPSFRITILNNYTTFSKNYTTKIIKKKIKFEKVLEILFIKM
jgi:hypothetical protein